MELKDLYRLYETNIKIGDSEPSINNNPIKVGDILVAFYNNKEIRGEVSAVYENYYVLKGKNGSTIKVTMDDINEHYPKNRSFENKSKKFSELTENEPVQPPIEKAKKSTILPHFEKTMASDQYKEKPKDDAEKVQLKKKKISDEEKGQEQKNNPDNSVDITKENIKSLGKLLYYKNMKYSDITSLFEKKLLNKDTYWYLLTEKSGEIHVVRNNDKGFEIQPFMSALVGHFLKNKDQRLNESFQQIKITGNNNFSVISNIPQNIHDNFLNSLIGLLSGIKK